MKVLVIPGSLRAGSYNAALARAASEVAPKGVDVEVYDGLAALPLFDDDLDGDHPPLAVRELRESIAEADALFVVTPEYNGSMSGALKNAIDWASRPRERAALRGMTTAIAGVTTGQYGAMWAQQDLRRVLGIAGARVIEGDLPVSRARSVFDESGRLVDELVAERLRGRLDALVAETRVLAAAA